MCHPQTSTRISILDLNYHPRMLGPYSAPQLLTRTSPALGAHFLLRPLFRALHGFLSFPTPPSPDCRNKFCSTITVPSPDYDYTIHSQLLRPLFRVLNGFFLSFPSTPPDRPGYIISRYHEKDSSEKHQPQSNITPSQYTHFTATISHM
jgi:hypothetical protein